MCVSQDGLFMRLDILPSRSAIQYCTSHHVIGRAYISCVHGKRWEKERKSERLKTFIQPEREPRFNIRPRVLLSELNFLSCVILVVVPHIYTFLLPIALGLLLLAAIFFFSFLLLFSSSRNGFRFGLGRALLVFEHYFFSLKLNALPIGCEHRGKEKKVYFVILNIKRSFARLL